MPGAHEPISPLIQMIMRMPGHIGLLNSFFEALQALFLPHLDLLPHLDPSLLADHGHQAANSLVESGTEHATIDLATLPDDAPILQTMQLESSQIQPFTLAFRNKSFS